MTYLLCPPCHVTHPSDPSSWASGHKQLQMAQPFLCAQVLPRDLQRPTTLVGKVCQPQAGSPRDCAGLGDTASRVSALHCGATETMATEKVLGVGKHLPQGRAGPLERVGQEGSS